MSGLNDNFMLVDDSMEKKDDTTVTLKVFKETSELGEEPELREDLDLISVAMEEFAIALRDMDLLKSSINEQGGMSAAIALEAQAILPELINEDRPIGFFTKHPSKTMLKVALEELDEKRSSLIASMIERIKEFIKNIIVRLKQFFAGSKEKNERAAQTITSFDETKARVLSTVEKDFESFMAKTFGDVYKSTAHAAEGNGSTEWEVMLDNKDLADDNLAHMQGYVKAANNWSGTPLDSFSQLQKEAEAMIRANDEFAGLVVGSRTANRLSKDAATGSTSVLLETAVSMKQFLKSPNAVDRNSILKSLKAASDLGTECELVLTSLEKAVNSLEKNNDEETTERLKYYSVFLNDVNKIVSTTKAIETHGWRVAAVIEKVNAAAAEATTPEEKAEA